MYYADFLRCAVEFQNVKDMVKGLNKFRVLIENETDDKRKGCIDKIVRIKNMFNDIVSWKDVKDYGYCDVKFNCIIKIGKYKMLVEIQFLIDFMSLAKKIGHIFYGFVRNEDLYVKLSAMMKYHKNSENIVEKTRDLRNIIGTKDYHLLSYFILYGEFDHLAAAKRKNKERVDFDKLLQLCKQNEWKKGYQLLEASIALYDKTH